MILKTSWEEISTWLKTPPKIGQAEIRRSNIMDITPTKHKSKQQHDRHFAKTKPRKKRIHIYKQFSRL